MPTKSARSMLTYYLRAGSDPRLTDHSMIPGLPAPSPLPFALGSRGTDSWWKNRPKASSLDRTAMISRGRTGNPLFLPARTYAALVSENARFAAVSSLMQKIPNVTQLAPVSVSPVVAPRGLNWNRASSLAIGTGKIRRSAPGRLSNIYTNI